MGNTQGVDPVYYWTIFKFFGSKRLWIIFLKKLLDSTNLYFFLKNLDFKIQVKSYITLWKGYAYILTENERLCIHSRLKKIWFDQGRPHEKANYKH